MSKVIFIEGVSGVGKTTMVYALRKRLEADGRTVKSWVEFDATNPIDFYCAAYVPNGRYQMLCQQYPEQAKQIKRYSIPTGDAVLVRYFNEDTPLFSEPLLGELCRMEFCYHPARPVPLPEYTRAYQAVWEGFDGEIDGSVDCYLFDGALMHHPLNDMLRNYGVSKDQAAAHVRTLLNCLKRASVRVFYLFSEDIAGQLRLARQNRRKAPPDDAEILFWEKRGEYDDHVLRHSVPNHQRMNVTRYGYDAVLDRILAAI